MDKLVSRLPGLTTILWILASLIAFGAFLYIAPNLLNPPAPTLTPTRVVTATVKATATLPATVTPLPVAPPPRSRTPAPTFSIPDGAQAYAFVADPTRSGYLRAGQAKTYWGDRNLHVGFFGGDVYTSILYFEIAALPPNSEIISAEVELTGLGRDNLGAQGAWRAELIHLPSGRAWNGITPGEWLTATAVSSVGAALAPTDLNAGDTNAFVFAADQLPALENQVNQENFVLVRLVGPTGPDNSLFTWDGGGMNLETGAHPRLRLVARPGNFVVVTNTPTAENVVTAAALAVRETDFVRDQGTLTPFPRSIATATPIVWVTPQPTAENVETRVALAQRATAVALTTGTYTPTPENWVEVTATFTPLPTRTPLAIPVSTLYARLTPTVPPTNTPTVREVLTRPLPAFLRGMLLVMTDRFKSRDIAVMRPDGALTQGLTGDEYYKFALAREPYSPDLRYRAVVAPDDREILQIWIQDQDAGTLRLVTHLSRGIAYDPVWSPDGGKIAYVSRETGSDEIYIYDLGSGAHTQITHGGNPFIYKQRPTWSPDSSRLAFKSNDGTPNFQIWLVRADGSELQNLSNSASNDTDPVWVK